MNSFGCGVINICEMALDCGVSCVVNCGICLLWGLLCGKLCLVFTVW